MQDGPFAKAEQRIQESLSLAKSACVRNELFHLSQSYTNSPGQAALVLCYVTCPDAMAGEFKNAIDTAVREVFAQHGMAAKRQV